MTNPESSPPPQPQPKNFGRIIAWGIVLGLVLTPFVVFIVIDLFERANPNCTDGGAEGSLDCVLWQLAITALSIPVGGVVGFFVAYWVGKRRYEGTVAD